jgi:hypothetical protein
MVAFGCTTQQGGICHDIVPAKEHGQRDYRHLQGSVDKTDWSETACQERDTTIHAKFRGSFPAVDHRRHRETIPGNGCQLFRQSRTLADASVGGGTMSQDAYVLTEIFGPNGRTMTQWCIHLRGKPAEGPCYIDKDYALDFAHMLSMARRDRESAIATHEPIESILQRRKWSLVWQEASGLIGDLMDDGWGCNYPNGTSVCEAAGRFPTPEDAVRQTEAWWVKYREGK